MLFLVLGIVLVVLILVAATSPVTTEALADEIAHQIIFNPLAVIIIVGVTALVLALVSRRRSE